jgi:hypothetical protein
MHVLPRDALPDGSRARAGPRSVLHRDLMGSFTFAVIGNRRKVVQPQAEADVFDLAQVI